MPITKRGWQNALRNAYFSGDAHRIEKAVAHGAKIDGLFYVAALAGNLEMVKAFANSIDISKLENSTEIMDAAIRNGRAFGNFSMAEFLATKGFKPGKEMLGELKETVEKSSELKRIEVQKASERIDRERDMIMGLLRKMDKNSN